ncbi:endo-alpha-N-acetylgalactosaminidase family protein [Actinoallomurus acanthiterrae]
MALYPSRPERRMIPSRFSAAASVAVLLASGLLAVLAAPAYAASADASGSVITPSAAPAAPENPATPLELTGPGLTVRVARDFPQVISYRMGGRELGGQARVLDTFTVNGKPHTATTIVKANRNQAVYTSAFADLPGLVITSAITVTRRRTVVFAVKRIEGSAASAVDQLSIPDQSLVSVDSSSAPSTLARTRISADSTTTADQFIAITGATPPDPGYVGTPYGIVSNGALAASIITNATDDSAQDNNGNWNTRLQSRIVDAGNGARRAELSVGNYTYAPGGATDPRVGTYALPQATVVLAADANGDGRVDWQDGAIAYRDHMPRPLGADRVPERVVQHIPFNFASQATNPFLKTLDNVMRISMATDDLGQWVLEKGYANAGHDSAHPDYGGDYNTRAGGLANLNTLTRIGAAYNADVAVHVNATEAYPQAKSFSDVLVKGQVNGWDWLNQSYHIDQRTDLGSGAVLDRFRELRKEAPGIKTVYIDAYYSSGWLADELAARLRAMGFEVATEWAYKFEGTSIWSHWASDKGYGPPTNKGINSGIVRFIANTDRDVWNVDPLLGGSSIKEFEGWTGHNDWNAFYQNIWTDNLPTKFLQHYQVMRWDFGKSATLTGGVGVTMVHGKRRISMGNAVVLDGDTYLLPWGKAEHGDGTSSPSRADKMYYYSASGDKHTFDLTKRFTATRAFTLYKLTDQGRVEAAQVKPRHGQVTLTAEKGQPYVLVPNGDRAPHRDPHYGQGTGLVDPGFNAGDLETWNPKGGATLARTPTGDNVVRLGTSDSGISQKVIGLTGGKQYALSANVEIAAGLRRTTTLSVSGSGMKAEKIFATTPARNEMAADAKQGTYSQRVSVAFTAPRRGKVTVMIGAGSGNAAVTIDDVRITADTSARLQRQHGSGGTVIAQDDFEGDQPGWGPFVKGDAGGATDPRTSISHLHAPYSQKAWKNTHSPYNAGTLGPGGGRCHRWPPLAEGSRGEHWTGLPHGPRHGAVHRRPQVHGLVQISDQPRRPVGLGDGGGHCRGRQGRLEDITRDTLAPALDTVPYSKQIVAGCGDTWVGLRKLGGAAGTDFVLDDLKVTDLGPVSGGAACASVTTPPSADLSPGVPSEYVTTFTNNERTDAVNVGMKLEGLPTGWTVMVKKRDGNLFGTVKPGATVSTTWILTPPKSTAGTSVAWKAMAVYDNAGVTKTVSADARASVATVPVLSPSSMTATADSENLSSGPAEGPVSNVLDGDPGTIWHTDYTNSNAPYPHWVTLKLGGAAEVNGFGYLDRQSGGMNGRVAGYEIAVSDDGTSWRTVTKGALVDSPQIQRISFDAERASYVRFTALNALNGQPFAAAAEMRVYGTSVDPPTGYPPAERP